MFYSLKNIIIIFVSDTYKFHKCFIDEIIKMTYLLLRYCGSAVLLFADCSYLQPYCLNVRLFDTYYVYQTKTERIFNLATKLCCILYMHLCFQLYQLIKGCPWTNGKSFNISHIYFIRNITERLTVSPSLDTQMEIVVLKLQYVLKYLIDYCD